MKVPQKEEVARTVEAARREAQAYTRLTRLALVACPYLLDGKSSWGFSAAPRDDDHEDDHGKYWYQHIRELPDYCIRESVHEIDIGYIGQIHII